MPTQSEDWHEKECKKFGIVTNYVLAKPGSIDDSVDVLSARLFGLGLRKDDLRSAVRDAQQKRIDRLELERQRMRELNAYR